MQLCRQIRFSCTQDVDVESSWIRNVIPVNSQFDGCWSFLVWIVPLEAYDHSGIWPNSSKTLRQPYILFLNVFDINLFGGVVIPRSEKSKGVTLGGGYLCVLWSVHVDDYVSGIYCVFLTYRQGVFINFQQMATWNLWYVFLGSCFHFAMGLVSWYDTQEEGRSRSRRPLRDWVMLDMLDACRWWYQWHYMYMTWYSK